MISDSLKQERNAEGLRLAARVLRGRPGCTVTSALEQVPKGHDLDLRGWRACWWVTDAMRVIAVRAREHPAPFPAVVGTAMTSVPSLCGIWPTAKPVGVVTIPWHQRAVLRAFAKLARLMAKNRDARIVARFVGWPDRPTSLHLEEDGHQVAELELHGSTWSGSVEGPMFNVDLLVQMIRGVYARVHILPADQPAIIEPASETPEPEWLGLLMPRKVVKK